MSVVRHCFCCCAAGSPVLAASAASRCADRIASISACEGGPDFPETESGEAVFLHPGAGRQKAASNARTIIVRFIVDLPGASEYYAADASRGN